MANQDSEIRDYRSRPTMSTEDFDTTMRTAEQDMSSMARDAADQVKQKTGEIADQVQEQAKSALANQKSQAAEQLTGVAQAFRQTGQHLRDQNQGGMADMMAQYTEKLADQVERFSTGLRNRDIDQMVSEAQDFARRQPALFIGGAFVAGVLMARFFKSSAQRQRYDMMPMEGQARTYSTMGTGYSTGTGTGMYNPPAETTEDFPDVTDERPLSSGRSTYGL